MKPTTMIGRKRWCCREENCVKRPRKIACARAGRFAKNEFRKILVVPGRWTPERANALAARLVGRICRTGPSNGAEPIRPTIMCDWGRCAGRAKGCGASGVVNGIRVLRALCGTIRGAEKRGAERRGAKLGAEK